MDSITLTQAIEGYSLAAHARRLSPRTLADYSNTYRKLHKHLGDRPIAMITVVQIRRLMAAHPHLSTKTLLDHHAGLSALWRWAAAERLVANPVVLKIQAPRSEKWAIELYTPHDGMAMLQSRGRSPSRKQGRDLQQTNQGITKGW